MNETSRNSESGEGEAPATEVELAAGADVTAVPPEEVRIRVPARHNQVLTDIIARVNGDAELKALWQCANVNAVTRLGMSDHGWVHVQIVANVALKLLRLLLSAGVPTSILRDHGLAVADAEVVVVLAALLHDLGMSIHRDGHENYSLFIAQTKVRELLAGLYPIDRATIVRSEVLHAISAHRSDQKPITVEAGVVRVADALDMASGRARVPFEAGHVNIHSLSAAAIEHVELLPGEEKAAQIVITMTSSAGIFQVDELLKSKLRNSGIAPYVEVVATLREGREKRLLERVRL